MPTYVVVTPEGLLTEPQKARMAAAITRVHSVTTGAPAYFAQVIFSEVSTGNYFVGGKRLQGRHHIYLHGHIRGGRDVFTKERLVLELMRVVAEAAQIETHGVQVYLAEIPARQIAEYGQLLPLPGEEAAWHEALPASVKARLAALGD